MTSAGSIPRRWCRIFLSGIAESSSRRRQSKEGKKRNENSIKFSFSEAKKEVSVCVCAIRQSLCALGESLQNRIVQSVCKEDQQARIFEEFGEADFFGVWSCGESTKQR